MTWIFIKEAFNTWCLLRLLTSLHRTFEDFLRVWPCHQHTTQGVPLCCLTCRHAIVSRSPWGPVRWPQTEGTANNERVHSFCWFLPNPFMQDLFLWHTSQEIVKMDLYPLSQGLWSLSPVYRLFDRVLVDNRPLHRCLCWRKTTVIKKTRHLIF